MTKMVYLLIVKKNVMLNVKLVIPSILVLVVENLIIGCTIVKHKCVNVLKDLKKKLVITNL